MTIVRTDEEIQAELDRLNEVKHNVPAFTMFGDNNIEAIEAQIDVLENKLSEDECFSKYEDPEDPDEMTHELNHARDAAMWLEGEYEEESLAAGWEQISNG